MTIEIVDFPSCKMVDLSSSLFVNVYQRVNLHFPMVFRFSYGFPMVFRFSYGFPMVFPLKPPCFIVTSGFTNHSDIASLDAFEGNGWS